MPASNQVVTLKIDGRDVSASAEDTVLEVARENGIFIPSLCDVGGLEPVGACRLCLVEIKGTPKLVPSCVVKVEDDMEVTTTSERLTRYRRMILELLFAERNHVCSVCMSNGDCELQALALEMGMTHVRIPYRRQRYGIDASHEQYLSDHNRCVLCARCVRVCGDIEGAHTRNILGRGVDSLVITDMNQPWGNSETCTDCGKCVNVCPTGALVHKGHAVSEVVKHREFLQYLTMRRSESRN